MKYVVLLVLFPVLLFGSVVKIEKQNDKFLLKKDGKTFKIKGLSGFNKLAKAKEVGANSILLYADPLDSEKTLKESLDQAKKYGLTVSIILDMGKERKGFDYSNSSNVSIQHKRNIRIVKSLKNHPSLLMWGIGNELHLNSKTKLFYTAINDLAFEIKKIDGKHPVFTTVSELNADVISNIVELCSSLDLLGFNSYGGVNSVADRLKNSQWKKPVLITEWGPTGHWELGKTSWGAPIEQTSGEKALNYEARYPTIENANIIVGSYAFYWGYKQEVTPTWYSLFNGDMTKTTEAVDYIQKAFTGKFPKNRAPSLLYVMLNDKTATANIITKPSQINTVFLEISDSEKDKIKYNVYVTKESIVEHIGGDYEPELERVSSEIIVDGDIIQFTSPSDKGCYRVFIEADDGHNHFASVNVPFKVE